MRDCLTDDKQPSLGKTVISSGTERVLLKHTVVVKILLFRYLFYMKSFTVLTLDESYC